MRKLSLVSMSALVLAGCAASSAEPAPAPVATATPAPYAPAIPKGTGIFAEPSTLPFQAPDFSKIKESDYEPAIEQGITIWLAEIDAIANNPAAPTFDNTMVAMENSGQMLTRVYYVFGALTSANTNDNLDAIDSRMSPKLAAARDAITLNPKLFARIKTLYDARDTLGLAPDQMQVLTLAYENMVRNGANLSDADKARLTDINGQLSTLQTDFGQKLTKGTKDGALMVTDRKALAGLSDADIAAAEKTAADRGLAKGSFVLSMQNTTQQPLAASLTNRATRQALFEKSWNRSERGDANDTRGLITKIAALRAEKAKLLGFDSFAAYALSDQMAKTPERAIGLLEGFLPALGAAQKKDAADLNALIKKQGGKFTVTPGDWDYYAEQLRKQRYALDQNEVKPYLEITNVLENGVFYAANQLYGLTFKKRTDIPVYHPDVTVYTVYDQDGSELALFYFDPWKRDNKSGGAWMSNFVDQNGLTGTKPVVFNVENFTKPAAGQPALITWDDANTMFHEFGHALHGMLSNQRYPSISGTNTARDFVEFPSQFMENFMTEPKVLANFAKHYKTGAPMPAELIAKIEKANTFNQGYALGEVMTAALLDLKWHSMGPGMTPSDVNAFEQSTMASLDAKGLQTSLVPSRYRTSYFRHIWGGGYAAGYYAYSWTEMLDHDAYAWFKENGGMTRKNGQHIRDTILSKGHSQDYSVMYRNFAGRDPSVEPMLKARGLK
ncbi:MULTISPECIES: M3 family metallopeptidase [unclassified Novosphingobium]|uniref:M3 family metallopeptidase n=1 Tax=unclassified Novosphingobium TaxID=2644732 RepID=UPI000ECF90FD|nr:MULTISPECIES: M3 family metallopeptidase [unclassified Novosphingobium]HCF25598.1 dipeptidyl carboxypeptidase II [Novosphingobium sp.]HQV04756.1 M3 family metallopeptidase [Novosphingobium sp.]